MYNIHSDQFVAKYGIEENVLVLGSSSVILKNRVKLWSVFDMVVILSAGILSWLTGRRRRKFNHSIHKEARVLLLQEVRLEEMARELNGFEQVPDAVRKEV